MRSFVFIVAAALLLTGCFSSSSRVGDTTQDSALSARVPSTQFAGQKVEIFEHVPQTIFTGRGYSFTAVSLPNSEVGYFDILTVQMADTDVRQAAEIYCRTLGGHVSRFHNASPAEARVRSYTFYFNCE